MSDLTKHLEQIKRQVYNGSPSHTWLIDEIASCAARLDVANAGNPNIQPISDKIVEVLWLAHGSPVAGTDWPAAAPVEPPPEEELPPEEGETRRKRKG